MRIVILLLILITFNVQAKKQKTLEIYIAPQAFGPVLIKPFDVDLHYPIPHLDFDPDKDTIFVIGKRYRDNTIGIVDNDVVLLSELNIHAFSLNILLDNDKSPNKIFSDLVNIKAQKAIAKINKIDTNFVEVNYEAHDLLNRSGMPNFKLVAERFLTPYISNLNTFLEDILIVNKFHEKVFEPRLPLTNDNIYDFSKFVNNQDYYSTDLYTCLLITLNKQQFKFEHVQNLYDVIIENNLVNLREKFDDGKINVKVSLTILQIDPNKRIFRKFRLQDNINKTIIGPILTPGRLSYIKVLKKENNCLLGELDFKARYCFFKKHMQQNTKNSINQKVKALKLLEELRNRLIKNKSVKENICKDTWLRDLDFNKNIRKQMIKLEKNDVSKILEDTDGWHLVKILEKHVNKRSGVYKNIYPIYRDEQLFLILENYLKTLRRQSYKIMYLYE